MGKFSSDLILWYKDHKRDLPWRETTEVYCIWVSEIILQQTRVNQGLSYYYNFLENFPTVHKLANATEDEVLKCWQGLGYYSRARNMHAAAKFVSEQLKGVFPTSYDGLLQLKGVGTYTAAAISSICFNEQKTVVDGNVFRVLTRIYGIETAINTANGKKEVEELAQSLNDGDSYGDFNQAIMEFGALHCTPKLPKCDTCIFAQSCWALKNSKVDVLPIKEKTLKIKKRYLTYLFVKDKEGNTIIQRRNENDIWKGLYQFPLLEHSRKCSVQSVLEQTEFVELIGLQSIKIRKEDNVKHILTHRHLFIKVLFIELDNLESFSQDGYQLVHHSELNSFAFPKPLSNIWEEWDK
ncbi:A/G-specific adenine glycosylase [Labilibacter marinus]|uniref:A/G-specific adenine glycosylase n=1 Tax=Labilibacter marinus TaxID=1477105 RepID=UPI00082990E9|nr:A/G-specific adenine glycosylase [Labilibacter marinus]